MKNKMSDIIEITIESRLIKMDEYTQSNLRATPLEIGMGLMMNCKNYRERSKLVPNI